jgi:hypothetical protein
MPESMRATVTPAPPPSHGLRPKVASSVLTAVLSYWADSMVEVVFEVVLVRAAVVLTSASVEQPLTRLLWQYACSSLGVSSTARPPTLGSSDAIVFPR